MGRALLGLATALIIIGAVFWWDGQAARSALESGEIAPAAGESPVSGDSGRRREIASNVALARLTVATGIGIAAVVWSRHRARRDEAESESTKAPPRAAPSGAPVCPD